MGFPRSDLVLTEEWWRWGGGKEVIAPSRVGKVRRYLHSYLKTKPSEEHAQLERFALPKSRAPAGLESNGISILTDDPVRLRHSFGRSYVDLLRFRRGQLEEFTDAVAYPRCTKDVQALVDLAVKRDAAIVPWGGGTSVVGGVTPLAGRHTWVLTVSLEQMSRRLGLDKKSMMARFECGIMGPQLEEELREHGLTLGHYPQSFEFSTLGGWIAARSSGQVSSKYGDISGLVSGATIVTPQGLVEWARPVSEAAGPEVDSVFIGSEGTLGIFTEATVMVSPIPEREEYRAVLFPDWDSGLEAIRELSQHSALPSLLRLSDKDETALTWAARDESSKLKGGIEKTYLRLHGLKEEGLCLAFIGYEGSAQTVNASWKQASEITSRNKGLDAGTAPGEAWKRERFLLPYLRDTLMDDGLFVETLETGVSWSKLPGLYKALSEEIRKGAESLRLPIHIGVHLSHATRAGTCAYVTMIAPQPTNLGVDEPYGTLKKASMRAITSRGGSLSHHHGVGTAHRPWVDVETDHPGSAVLGSIKRFIDPTWNMNPGKTLPQ